MFSKNPNRALEKSLEAAQAREQKAVAALAPKHKGGEWEEYEAAVADVMAAERALAAARGEPHAVPIEFPVRWSIGAPLPYLLQNDYRTFLVFFVHEADPNWDGTYTTIQQPNSADANDLAIVEFRGCVSAKMGAPNDEVLHGHPVHGKGLEGYRAMKLENSPWLKELEDINSVHAAYKPAAWKNLSHYFFGFHDSTFECVAESFVVERREASLSNVLSEVCARLI